ncbi:MAG: DUF1565 domain-containing protein [Planctomycetes bacterium]|nr:DUF1565 domain-containing protein [Planctomycetota bacterium]
MRNAWIVWTAIFVSCLHAEDAKKPLPLPALKVPESPVLAPAAITAGGRRLLLSEADITVSYRPTEEIKDARALVVNRPGWWVINYPLTRITGLEGKSPDDIGRLLFHRPAAEIKNWYVKSPGPPPPEPPEPTGPAPIVPTPHPTIIVNRRHPNAKDSNPGTADAPLATITAAAERAKAGDVIHVYPGIYREAFTIEQNGTREKPIRLEGIRGRNGNMPVISGNDLFPKDAWTPVPALEGVYRADIPTEGKFMGTMSADGVTLTERSLPSELRENEYCFNRASTEFLNLRFDGGADFQGGKLVRADKDGFLDLGAAFGEKAKNAVVWASTYVWIPPGKKRAAVWDPRFPEPITGRIECDGQFRAFRMTGAKLSAQVNKFRLWVNGKRMPSCIRSTCMNNEYRECARFNRNYGFREEIHNLPLREGWNHLVFQFDTTTRPKELRFKMGSPKGVDGYICTARKPADLRAKPTAAEPTPYISEVLTAGPFPGKPDLGAYVRLKENRDPNSVAVDVAARGILATIEGSFVHLRGFEIRHGGQFQQRGQVHLFGERSMVEGCLIRDSEVSAICFQSVLRDKDKKPKVILDQNSTPTVIRGNWIINPGNVGIAGSCSSEFLTAENMNTSAPGRSRFLIEHNKIVNPNWTGIKPFWASGGMKVFKLTGTTIRYNTIEGGTGPGIWLDWEHYGNRLEGNLSKNGWAMLIGIEASPGPNLIANNLCVDLRPGEAWFRWALLSWSSGRNWVINNTIDGRWNKTPAWQRKTGGDGINVGCQYDDRGTRWGALPERTNVHMNNIIVGCKRAIRSRPEDINAVNLTDEGTGAMAAPAPIAFRNPEHYDYRLKPDSALNVMGVKGNTYTRLVKHDFHGLLRFDDPARSVGAFRCEYASASKGAMVEVETTGGKAIRLYPVKPLPGH